MQMNPTHLIQSQSAYTQSQQPKRSESWMQALAEHFEKMRGRYPDADLLILFDIDGTIFDVRYMLLYLLQAYDQHHGTTFFMQRSVADIDFNADELATGLVTLNIPSDHHAAINHWYEKYRWSMAAILEAHRPFPGVLEVIRWFQLQPQTHVGLNTARPESLREETLCSLNKLGREYRVYFNSDLLFMRPASVAESVAETKVAGVEHFHNHGYRVFAMVDNQSENLQAVASIDAATEILLLQAGKSFNQRNVNTAATTVHGNVYDLTQLISKKTLPRHVQFVWRGVSCEASLSQFLAANVSWADVSAMTNPCNADLRLADISNPATPRFEKELVLFRETLARLRHAGRGIKLDLHADRQINKCLIETLQASKLVSEALWFHADVEHLNEAEFRYLAETHPGAIIEIKADFLAPLIQTNSPLAEQILDRLSDWGINRFALSWQLPGIRSIHDTLDHWGFDTTIYDVRGLESFLQAVLLTPQAICSEFNFPQWHEQLPGKRRLA
ncbi:MAG: hypothetical protein WD572_12125 [Gammaproteobacteria bacterium]